MPKLLIVESPGKKSTLQKYLGNDWRVEATVGHIRDLPQNAKEGMGVNPPDFKPEYVFTERGKSVAGRLESAVRWADADEVYLATDPDREGEAISWHVQEVLHLKNPKRVTFSEITEKAVKTAIAKPRTIDMNLVWAQEARRVLDRLCGYLVSIPLSNAASVGKTLSAGRVQSPAVRLVVEREKEIQQFTSTTHYGVELTFEAVENISDGWKAIFKPELEEGQRYFLDKAFAEKITKLRTLSVVSCEETENRNAPPAPFTTSSLQQAASNALKFSPKRTMELAQKLYEAGHITYMRTDSPNISGEFIDKAKAFCEDKGLPVVDTPRIWKSKAGAQEAHEAIRPTHIEIEDAGEYESEQQLYCLIRLRALACILEDAVYSGRILKLQGEVDGHRVNFEARGRLLISAGWRVLVAADQTEDLEDTTEPDNPVPAFKLDDQVTAVNGRLLTQKTKPPTRFTEASLVKELEKRGIGRPATYAAILDTIIAGREYLKLEKRFLIPTQYGEVVVSNLRGNFGFIDFDYTRNMEESLDAIADGKADYKSAITALYNNLSSELKAFQNIHAIICPECGKNKVRRIAKKDAYDFFACPDCDARFENADGKLGNKFEKSEKKPQKLSDYKCKAKGCGKALIRRQGTNKKGEKYDFYGCSGFPNCKQTYQVMSDEKPDYEAAGKK